MNHKKALFDIKGRFEEKMCLFLLENIELLCIIFITAHNLLMCFTLLDGNIFVLVSPHHQGMYIIFYGSIPEQNSAIDIA